MNPSTAPCGTRAAYQQHYKRGEKPCPACKEAHNAPRRTSITRPRMSRIEWGLKFTGCADHDELTEIECGIARGWDHERIANHLSVPVERVDKVRERMDRLAL